jgi:hypothetical protein
VVYFSIRANDHIFIFARSERTEPYQRLCRSVWQILPLPDVHQRQVIIHCNELVAIPQQLPGGVT